MKNPTPKSPKNKFVAQITYKDALSQIGSASSIGGMTLEDVKHNAKFYTEQATRNGTSSTVVIKENKKTYPDFDWVDVEKFEI